MAIPRKSVRILTGALRKLIKSSKPIQLPSNAIGSIIISTYSFTSLLIFLYALDYFIFLLKYILDISIRINKWKSLHVNIIRTFFTTQHNNGTLLLLTEYQINSKYILKCITSPTLKHVSILHWVWHQSIPYHDNRIS